MFKITCLLAAKTAVAALSVAAAAVATPVRNAAAETSLRQLSCTTMLRVVGVTSDDVLFLRDTPSLPRGSETTNKLVGIPSGAQGIEALGETTDGWRLVRYKGIVGYVRSNFLSPDILICAAASFGTPIAVRTRLAEQRIPIALQIASVNRDQLEQSIQPIG